MPDGLHHSLNPLKKGQQIELQSTYSGFCGKMDAKSHHTWA
jgi:hypothetical protein